MSVFSRSNVRAARITGRQPYPHMGPGDRLVWQWALRLGLVVADRFDYDVRLGGSGAVGVDAEHELWPMWQTLLMKRVDVVAWREGRAQLIEVKPVAGFSALGQALGYASIWRRERGPADLAGTAVVAAFCDADLVETYRELGVSMVCLPAEVSEGLLPGLVREVGGRTSGG